MRAWTLLGLFSTLLVGALATTADGDQERERLQGDWQVTSMIDDGELIPEARVKEHFIRDGRISIQGPILRFVNPETHTVQESAFVLSPDVRPRAIDLAGRGRTRSKGIYMLDGDTLVVCLASPDAKDRPDEFGSRKGSNNLLLTFKRLKETPVRSVSRTISIEPERPATPPTVDTASRVRKQLMGTWGHQNDDDVFLITFNPDGTFSSTRTPKRGFRRIFREPVRTSGTWKLEDNVIVVRVTASTERDLQNQILSYRLRSLSDSQIMLIDSTGRTHIEWKTP